MHEFLKDDYNLDALTRVRPSGDDFDMYVTPRFVPVYANGYEVLSTRIVKQFVSRKDLFIDVGAHYGYYSLLAAKANPGIRIAAVEPIEDNFRVLQKNLQLNGLGPERATCIPAAMSSQAGRAQFCKSEASDNGSLYPHPSSETLARIEVATTCLDDVVGPEKGRRIFVKTDTDGHELEVLKGFSRTLDAGGDVTILLEMNPKMMKISGTSAEEIIAFLHGKDFRLFAIDDREARFYPLDQSVNVAMMEARYRESYYNVLCVRKSAALSVLFFSHAVNLTGAERSLVDLVQGLSARGVLCTAILPAPGPLREALVKSGCAVHVSAECSLQGRGWWWAHTAKNSSALPALASASEVVRDTLIPEIRKLAPDVVFSQTIVSPWGAWCAESLGLPHALSAREYGERDHHLAFAFGFRESMEALYASSDAVFCITEDVKKALFGGDPDRKAVAVYSDVRIPPALPSAAASGGGNEPAPPRAALTVGIFGSIAGEKGQADLVRACLELCKKGRDVRCVLAGLVADPAYAGALHRQIADSPFADRFVWPDFTDDPYALMRQVDVVVSCSKMEALGRTLLEGVLLGKPIVYANAGGPREIFADGQQGLAYEPGDPAGLARVLESILEDPRAAAARARQAREDVLERFNDESYAGRIFERLKEMARRRPDRCPPAVRELMEKSGLSTMYLSVAQPRLLYADAAGPFSESRAVVYGEMPFGAFDIAFDLPDGGFPHLRFDPTELYAVAASIFDLIITAADGAVLTPDQIGMETNAECVDELTWKFGTLDPQIVWTLPVRAKRVRIVGELKKTSASQLVADLAAVRRKLAGTIDADQLKLEDTIAAVRQECKNEAAAIDSTVFMDDGAGYGEGNKAVARLEFRPATNAFAVEFPLPPGGPARRKIRWDPCEDRFCRCRIVKVETDGTYRGIGRRNAWKTENGWDEFMTGDPVYELEGEWAQATFIRISGELILPGADAVADRFQGEVAAARRECEAQRKEVLKLEASLEAVRRESEALRQEIGRIHLSRSWRWTRLLRWLDASLAGRSATTGKQNP